MDSSDEKYGLLTNRKVGMLLAALLFFFLLFLLKVSDIVPVILSLDLKSIKEYFTHEDFIPDSLGFLPRHVNH